MVYFHKQCVLSTGGEHNVQGYVRFIILQLHCAKTEQAIAYNIWHTKFSMLSKRGGPKDESKYWGGVDFQDEAGFIVQK